MYAQLSEHARAKSVYRVIGAEHDSVHSGHVPAPLPAQVELLLLLHVFPSAHYRLCVPLLCGDVHDGVFGVQEKSRHKDARH